MSNDDTRTIARPWYLRYPLAVWKYVVGIVLCQNPLSAVLIVGWTGRLMRRRVLRSWWKQSPLRSQGTSFDEFVSTLPTPCAPRTLPNWCLAEPLVGGAKPQAAGGSRLRGFLRRAFGSLSANFRQGFAAALSIFVFTLPATSLWLFAWVLGWNISFFKLYEQSHLGASLGLFGVLLFILAMLYVPLAHARQAVTGQWRRFFDLRNNWRLARRNPATMLPAAIAFVLASVPVMVIRIAPYFVGSGEQFATMSVDELRQWLDNYHLAAGALLLPAYVFVWLAAAKGYARAAANEYAADPTSERLCDFERQTFASLYWNIRSSQPAHAIVRGASWTVGRMATTGALALTCVAWFAVAGQIFIAQFLNYLPGAAWLNHPLVLLPWIKYVPPGLGQ